MRLCGSFPGLRTTTTPADRQHATAVPKMNPRLSAPTTRSMFFPRNGLASSSTASAMPDGSASRGVMSRNRMPGLGKSLISRINRFSRWTGSVISMISREELKIVRCRDQIVEVQGRLVRIVLKQNADHQSPLPRLDLDPLGHDGGNQQANAAVDQVSRALAHRLQEIE